MFMVVDYRHGQSNGEFCAAEVGAAARDQFAAVCCGNLPANGQPETEAERFAALRAGRP